MAEFDPVRLSRILGNIQSSIDKLPDEELREKLKQIVTTEIKKKIQIADQPTMQLLSIKEIAQTEWPEPDWLVSGLLPVGLGLLAGRPKVGKSTLANQVGFSLAAGKPFLGKEVSKGRVAIFALEDPPQRIKKMITKHNWPIDLQIEYLLLGQFEEQVGTLAGEGLERFERQINHREYRLVVIDTLSRAFRGDQNDVDAMTKVLTPLQEIAHSSGCSILLIDHHRKRGVFGKDTIDDILGSTAKSAIPDTIWGLYRQGGKSYEELYVTGRDVREATIRIQKDKRSGFWYSEGKKEQLIMTERRAELLVYIENHPNSTVTEIAKGVGQEKGNTHRRLQDMVHGNVIEFLENGGKKVYGPSDNGTE